MTEYGALAFVRRALFMAVALMFLSGPARGDTINIMDNFNDNSLNTSLWTPVVLGTGSLSEAGGHLEASATATKGVAFSVAGVGNWSGTIAGDFEVTFSYTLLSDIPLVDQDAGVGIVMFAGGLIPYVGIGRGAKTDEAPIHEQSYNVLLGAEVFGTEHNEWKYPTTENSGRLRLTRVGDLVSAYYMGLSDWVLLHQEPGLAEPLTGFALFAQMGEGQIYTASGAFDDFQLQAAQFTPIPEPASILLLGTGLGVIGFAAWRRHK